MALVVYKNGARQLLKPGQAKRLWLCINGFEKPKNIAQTLYIESVDQLYLGPRTKHLLIEEQKKRQLELV